MIVSEPGKQPDPKVGSLVEPLRQSEPRLPGKSEPGKYPEKHVPARSEPGKQPDQKPETVSRPDKPSALQLAAALEPGKQPDRKAENTTDLERYPNLRPMSGREGARSPEQGAAPAMEKPGLSNWRQSWGEMILAKPSASAPSRTGSTGQQEAGKGPEKPPAPASSTTAATNPDRNPKKPLVSELPHADTRRPDPLLEPDQHLRHLSAPKTAVAMASLPKLDSAGAEKTSAASLGTLPPPGPSKTLTPGGAVPAGSATTAAPASGGQLPLGAQSVLASGNVQYVPVPVVTLPPVQGMPPPTAKPPYPPNPQIPRPPQPNCWGASAPENGVGKVAMVNAFTPAEEVPPSPASAQGRSMHNAFSSVYGTPSNSGMFPPACTMPPAPMGGPFGAVPPGYPPMPGQAAARMMPPGPAGNPYGPVVQLAMLPTPAGGREAAGWNVVPVAYQGGTAYGLVPPTPVPWIPANTNPQQLLSMLREALYPSQREWAAEKLAGLDWRTNDWAVRALVQGAREDPAPTVRAECVRTLARMKVDTISVVTTLQGLQSDSDVRVRDAAGQALAILAPNLSAAGPPSWRPTDSPAASPAPPVMPSVSATPTPVPAPATVPAANPAPVPSSSPIPTPSVKPDGTSLPPLTGS
jgi:hypothetical protein